MPQRIQRRRVRGWRKPQGAVIVDRTSRWGNPFTVADVLAEGHADTTAEAHRRAAARFRAWLLCADPAEPDIQHAGGRRFDRRWMRTHLPELRGHDLCCPCPPSLPCHADALLALANDAARLSRR